MAGRCVTSTGAPAIERRRRSVPPGNQVLCWEQVICNPVVDHRAKVMPESELRKHFRISPFNALLPQKWVHTSWYHICYGCGREHLTVFAKSGLLGRDRGKELAQHVMFSLPSFRPPSPFFFSLCDINLQKRKEAAGRWGTFNWRAHCRWARSAHVSEQMLVNLGLTEVII